MTTTMENSKELEDNYYSVKMLSVSSVKKFLQNPARALDDWNGVFPWFSKSTEQALIYGNYVHSAIQDALENTDVHLKEFAEAHPSLYKKDGTLYAKYSEADSVAKIYINSKPFQDLLKYINEPNKELYVERAFQSSWKGVAYKGKLDVMIVDTKLKKVHCIDFKTSRPYPASGIDWYDTYTGERTKGQIIWDVTKLYPVQAGVYRNLLLQNGYEGYNIEYSYIVITKESTPRIDVWKISDEAMEKGFDIFKTALVDADTYINDETVVVPVIDDDSVWAKRRTWEKPNILTVDNEDKD